MNLRDILRQAGFSGAGLNTAYAIAMAESGGNAKAFNGNAKTGDKSYGLFQINMLGGMGPERRKQFGLSNDAELYDAVTNAKIAYKMSKGGTSWTPWSTFNNDSYKKYLSGNAAVTGAATGAATGLTPAAQALAPDAPADIIGSHVGNDFAPDATGFGPKRTDFSASAVKQQPAGSMTTPGTPGSPGKATGFRDKIIAAAMSQLGVSYSWGGGGAKGASVGFGKGAGVTGFDCSSLMMYAYAQAGMSIPRTGRPQLAMGKKVPLSQLQPGDFLGWGNGHHIAMYIGNGQYIQAPSTGGHVEIKSIKGTSAWGVHLSLPGD